MRHSELHNATEAFDRMIEKFNKELEAVRASEGSEAARETWTGMLECKEYKARALRLRLAQDANAAMGAAMIAKLRAR